MPTFPTRLGRGPVLIATGAVALVLFGLLLLAGRSGTPASVAQLSPSAAPAAAAPSVEAPPAAQPQARPAEAADKAARPEPTNTRPPTSPVPSKPPAPAAAASGGSADVALADKTADAPLDGAARPAAADPARPRDGGSSATAPAQPALSDPAQRYVDVAQRAAPPHQGQRPGSNWEARVVGDNQGYAVMLIMPLDAGTSNAAFVRAAKERIAAIVNAVFLNDPQVIRVGVIGTFPNQGGAEVPAVSMIVNKAASPRWGQISPTELERIAQSLTVEEPFLR